jgi:cell division protein FtsI (penicillin-binding protein 3)/stage V sporulation protein D (sporulation-specific penicillin-binding protein)
MANYPNFDPNNYRQEELESFQNSAIQKLFEPGSVFKAFTMAAGLNEGKVTPQTTFKDKGYIDLGGSLIRNYDRRTWGEQTMIEVLKKSINTGAVFVEQELGRELFLKYSKRFGFTQLTGIDLVGETYSRNENLVSGCERDLAAASFGQGIAVTPIQLVTAFGAIANNGKLIKPFVVSSIQGKEEVSSKSSKQIITSNSASQLTSMLTQVVEEGFGRKAGIPGYFLAGKTGTAQVINEEGVYDPNKTIQSFIGFGPTLDPQFLILIKLDGPQAKSSSESAAPIFKKMAQYIINRYQIPPTVESL